MAKRGDKVYDSGAMPGKGTVRTDKTAANSDLGFGFGIGKGQSPVKTFGTGKGLSRGGKKGMC